MESPHFWDHYRWQDLDLPVWSRNKASVVGLGVPWWWSTCQSEKSKKCWEEKGAHFLCCRWSCGNNTTWASKDSDCTVVHHSCPPTGSPKIARKAPNSWTERHPIAPWQCLCPCHPFDKGFCEGIPVQLLSHPPYSLDLTPGWLLSGPYGEGRTVREAVFNTWRRGCSIPRGALCTGWQWLAPVLQIVVQEDATLHRCSRRVLW